MQCIIIITITIISTIVIIIILGTPEIAGLTTAQALEIIRGTRGLNIVSADVVEVLIF